jgi:hypothetical protein
MKKLFFTIVVLLFINSSYTQGVYIASGSNLYIGSGATVSLDSLVLKPSAGFNLTGLRREYRNTAVVHALSRTYIKRVYHFSTTTPAFSGALSVYYKDGELNGIAEPALTLNVHNGTSWNTYTSGVLRNGTTNVVTTTLASVALNELTLASNTTTAVLTLNKEIKEPEEAAAFGVYPNPVVEVTTVHLRTEDPGPATLQLFDASGALLQEQQLSLAKGGNQLQLNLSTYAKGSYTLVLSSTHQHKTLTLIKQ